MKSFYCIFCWPDQLRCKSFAPDMMMIIIFSVFQHKACRLNIVFNIIID